VRNWLKRRPAWQFCLVVGGVVFLGAVVTGAAVQWLWHGHLDFSSLLGSATGATLGTLVIAVGYRVTQSRPR
jgi:NhaP-type Na+/H+ or K+/H+ antiporter